MIYYNPLLWTASSGNTDHIDLEQQLSADDPEI